LFNAVLNMFTLLPKYVMEHIGLFIQISVAQNYKTRNFPRFPFDSRLTITVYRAGERLRFWGRAANISESGMAATVSTQLSLGEAVTLSDHPKPATDYHLKTGQRE